MAPANLWDLLIQLTEKNNLLSYKTPPVNEKTTKIQRYLKIGGERFEQCLQRSQHVRIVVTFCVKVSECYLFFCFLTQCASIVDSPTSLCTSKCICSIIMGDLISVHFFPSHILFLFLFIVRI